jgi:AraC-like DNA-binding protein/mannose-6-phosphate isomerase-like protein (cupin superfamily)
MTLDLNSMFNEETPRQNEKVTAYLESFPIFIKFHERYGRTSFHNQPGIEVHITHEGRGILRVGGKSMLQSPKQVAIFRASVPHQLTSDPSLPYSRTVICIDDDQITHPIRSGLTDLSWITADDCLTFTFQPAAYATIDELSRQLHRETSKRPPGWEQMSFSIALNIMVLLQRMAGAVQQPVESPKGVNSTLVQRCLDYILGNLNEDLSLNRIASMFSVSSEHLTRIFTKEHGISFYQFVLMTRISEAKRLLQIAPYMTITDIALTVGFESSGQLSRTFRRFTNETPVAYRKKSRSLSDTTEA